MSQNDKHGKNDIDGWMSDEELQWLFERGSEMRHVVEIGSFKGRSTHALISSGAMVYSVDPYLPMSFVNNDDRSSAEDRYIELMERFFLLHNFRQIRSKSEMAERLFAPRSVDMVFVDGDHEFESVDKDIRLWYPKVKKLICGHDYGYADWPGVKQAVDRYFGHVKTVGSIWYVEIK